jgi:hypothetical protein
MGEEDADMLCAVGMQLLGRSRPYSMGRPAVGALLLVARAVRQISLQSRRLPTCSAATSEHCITSCYFCIIFLQRTSIILAAACMTR